MSLLKTTDDQKRRRKSSDIPCQKDYHNALERKRRQLISDKFDILRRAIPEEIFQLESEKASRSIVLKMACKYIETLRSINEDHEAEIEKLKQENEILMEEISRIESRSTWNKSEMNCSAMELKKDDDCELKSAEKSVLFIKIEYEEDPNEDIEV